MSSRDASGREPSPGRGSRTAEEGTPVAVDVSADLRARKTWLVFLAGPVIWFIHFMLVYVVVEAGCNGDGPGLRLFDPPVPVVVTLAATAVAAIACLATAVWGYGRWRKDASGEGTAQTNTSDGGDSDDPSRALGFAGFLLSVLAFLSVLIVGLPALVLPSC